QSVAAGGANLEALATLNGKLYVSDSNGRVYVSTQGSIPFPINSGYPVTTGASGSYGLTAFNGALYAADNSGRIYRISPVTATVSGADATTASSTLTGMGLNLAPSTSAATCSGSWPCGATNQVIFTASDRAGNTLTTGPFAILVDTSVSPSTPTAPTLFTGTAQSPTSILWTWKNNATNQTGYRVMSGAVNISGDLLLSATSWLQTGLSTNTRYGPYAARAFNTGGTSDSLSASSYTLADIPSAPIVSNTGPSGATLTWSANTNPAGTVWDLQRSTAASFLPIYTSSAAAGYADTVLTLGTTYYYKVRAKNGDGVFTSFTSTAAVIPSPPAIPAASSGLSGAAQSAASILWTWTNNAANSTGCRVMAGAINLSGDLAATTTWWLQTGLSTNTQYGPYFVRVFNSSGTADSASAFRYTLANVPSGLAASDIGAVGATLSWSSNTNPAGTIWDLQRSDGSGFSSIYSSAAAAYADTSLTLGATYFYQVRAKNGNGLFTSFTGSVTVVAQPSLAAPAAPSSFTGTAQDATSILWTWTSNASSQLGYRIMSGTVAVSPDLSPSAVSWLQTGLSTNTQYGPYLARAFNGVGSTDSGGASRSTLAGTPAGLTAIDLSSRSATLSWSSNGNPAGTIWDLQRSTDGASYSSIYVSTDPAAYADTGLVLSTSYYYQVRARNREAINTPFDGPITIFTAVLPSSWTLLAVSTPSYPADTAYVNVQPNFAWTGPSTTTVAHLPGGSVYTLQVSKNDPNFAVPNIVINISTPAIVRSTASPTADGAYISTFSLATDATYYWRVATNGGAPGPSSQVFSFVTDFVAPAQSGAFASLSSTGGAIGESQVNDSLTGVAVQLSIQDAGSGLAVSSSVLPFPGSGIDPSRWTTGFSVSYSTNAGKSWIGLSTITATNGSAAIGDTIRELAVYNDQLFAGDLVTRDVYAS
ncbi:MAG: fibronectin type III domain-containing protein, partial [Elusimicrobia bacterium]|nr:fibronectin type III domain-containing protein [Elusimicrobiota bacterium]